MRAPFAATIRKCPCSPHVSVKKIRIKSQPQLRLNESNKAQRKNPIKSVRRLRRLPFLAVAPRGELRKRISLDQGTSTGDGRLMRAGAVPGMGLVTPSAGGSETRPACHDAGLPGAGCPGSACRRYHEARDRTEPRSRGFGESRGRAPRGERASQKGRAPRGHARQGVRQLAGRGPRNLPRAFRRSASLFWEHDLIRKP